MGPPVIGAGAKLAMEDCDVSAYVSAQYALQPNTLLQEIFGDEDGAVIHMLDCTLLSNWNVSF